MIDDEKLLGVIAGHREAVLATIRRDGRPQLSNVMYTWDAQSRMARVSTTATRAKARNLRRDPRATLYVPPDEAQPQVWRFQGNCGSSPLQPSA